MNVPLSYDALDTLCPMHLVIAPDGQILHVGPTLRKLSQDRPLKGQSFLKVFEVKRSKLVNHV